MTSKSIINCCTKTWVLIGFSHKFWPRSRCNKTEFIFKGKFFPHLLFGMFIPDPGVQFRFLILYIRDPGSRIPDPGSNNRNKKRRGKNCCAFFVAKNLTKLKLFYFWTGAEKNLSQLTTEFYYFLPKKLSKNSQKYVLGIRDPEKNLFRIPDPGVKKAPDSGSGSATFLICCSIFFPLESQAAVSVRFPAHGSCVPVSYHRPLLLYAGERSL